jgi:phage/plasmid-like protein (TIGR03299 family)
MSHMVDRMMYSGQVPWHGLGDYQTEITFDDASKVLCTVEERPITYMHSDKGDIPVEGYKAIVRTDNDVALCVQKDSYGVVQYTDQLDVLQAAAGHGLLRLKTVGMLDEGRRAFALADLPSSVVEVAGSPILPYLLMSTSHDSSRKLRYLFTGVYVVCNNTETAALRNSNAKDVLEFKHTANIKDKLQVARALIEEAKRYFGSFGLAALHLVKQRFTDTDMSILVRELFPVTKEQAERYSKYGQPSAPHEARAKVLYLFSGAQRAAANAPGTKWSAYNAVTEYIDHHTTRRGQSSRAIAESRFDATLFGGGAQVRQKALDYLLAA